MQLVYGAVSGPSESRELPASYPSLKTQLSPSGRLSPNFRLMMAPPTLRPVPPDPPREMFFQVSLLCVTMGCHRILAIRVRGPEIGSTKGILRSFPLVGIGFLDVRDISLLKQLQ